MTNDYPVVPTVWEENPYQEDYYERDYFVCADGWKEFPEHHCKLTWLTSKPFIKNKRNALDIGCRDGEYTRYLQHEFEHVYCFDYRRRRAFPVNVSLKNVTHFHCGLAETRMTEKVSGGSNMKSQKIPQEKWYEYQFYSIDEFNIENVDYIKMDVDGFERRILKGAANTIEKYKPLIILEQAFGDTTGIDYLTEYHNYEVVAWDESHYNVVLREKNNENINT